MTLLKLIYVQIMKNKSAIYIRALLVIFLTHPFGLEAQTKKLTFEHITTRDGLSQSTITCSLQDSDGFMWFGTQDGLNRYDGYSFAIYHHIPNDSTSLTGNFIYRVVEDSNGNLWVGTESGLNMFNRSKNSFIRYQHDVKNPSSLGGNEVRALLEDSQGNLWVGTVGGDLDRLDSENGEFIHYRDGSVESGRVSQNIYSIYEDSRNRLWIGSMNGDVSLFNRKTGDFSPVYYRNEKLSNKEIWNITGDSKGNVWICTYRNGLYVVRISGNEEPEIVHYKHDRNDASSISSDFIFTAYEDREGHLWVGTENGGLNLFDRKSEVFTHYRSDPFDEKSLNNNSIWSILEDKTGNLWIGTHVGGINLHTRYGNLFSHFKHIPGRDNSLSHNSVTTFSEDMQGNIWIGTDGGGINLFDRVLETSIHYNAENSGLSSDAVMSTLVDSRGRLWVGTWEGGLNLFDKDIRRFIHFTTGNSNLCSNTSFSILEDRRGIIWIGSFFGGLSYYDESNNNFINYTPQNSSLSDNLIRMILEDSNGVIWACGATGLNSFDPETETFTLYSYDPTDPNSLSKGYVVSILEATDSTLWIGTTSGLNRFDMQKKLFTHYYVKEGLRSNAVKAIEEDDQGHLWLSTNKGLSRLDPETGVIVNYDISDGLQGNEFYQCSSFKSSKGELYFGGINGFNVFHPGEMKTNPFVPPVVITDFQLFNKPVEIGDHSPLRTHINTAKTITLSHRQTVFSFQFSALNYISSEQNQYAYILDGFDEEWNFAGTKHTASYTNIDPGKYTFRVKASNNNGVWNEEGTSVKIKVTPPFWQTWGFRIVAILFLASATFFIYYMRVRQVLHRNLMLQEQVEERTKEVIEKNTLLLDQTEELTTQRDQLNATNSVKDKLFSIISHDLRSPFNTMKGFIELISLNYAQYSEEKKIEMIGMIHESAESLYTLLDNLLNWSRSQRGKLKFNPRPTNMISLIIDKIDLMNYQAVSKSILLGYTSESDEIILDVDPDLINVVMQNLLTNALKFTQPGGKILVNCKIEKNYLIIAVSDTGVGISKDNVKKLFRSDIHFTTRGTKNETGTGLGILICKDFVEMNHGEIWVESELNKGSTFYVKLPVSLT